MSADLDTGAWAERTVTEAICDVAPELAEELGELDAGADVWTELGLDSMDHLSVMERLSAALGRDVPESDYPALLTLAAMREYVAERRPA